MAGRENDFFQRVRRLINGQIPVFATAILSFRFVLEHRFELLRFGLFAVPAFLIVTFGLDSYAVNSTESKSVLPNAVRSVIDLGGRAAIASAVLVAWHRLVMLKLADVEGGSAAGPGLRETRYLLVSLLLSVGFLFVFATVIAGMVMLQFLVMLLLYLALFLIGLADTVAIGQRDQFLVVLWIAIFFAVPAASYVAGRLSLVLPALAVDRRRPLRHAWRMTAGNGWRLVAASLLVLVPMELIAALCGGAAESARHSLAYYPLATLSAISMYLLIALTGTVLSLFSLQLDGGARREDSYESGVAIAE